MTFIITVIINYDKLECPAKSGITAKGHLTVIAVMTACSLHSALKQHLLNMTALLCCVLEIETKTITQKFTISDKV